MFAVRKFHSYLYGRRFILLSDHKPLLGLLHESRAVPAMASGRIQRSALILAAYNYKLQHKGALSRLPLSEKPLNAPTPAEVVLEMDQMAEGPSLLSKFAHGQGLTLYSQESCGSWSWDSGQTIHRQSFGCIARAQVSSVFKMAGS